MQPEFDGPTAIPAWQVPSRSLPTGPRPWLMGILNLTPDSFSDGGEFTCVSAAVAHAAQLQEDGADFLDVGGESTRPGATPISESEELRRIEPVVRELAGQLTIPISIDTTKAAVARRAIEAGAVIVNDISGLTLDPEMIAVCRDTGVGVVLMHIQGTPQTMQIHPHYDDVVAEVLDYFERRIDALETAGIPADRIAVDPGIGFGKTAGHNLELLSNITRFHGLGRPVLIGHSRKRFLGKLLGRNVDERGSGTLGVSLVLAAHGVDVLRVHDVRAHRDALLAWRAVVEAARQSSAPHRANDGE